MTQTDRSRLGAPRHLMRAAACAAALACALLAAPAGRAEEALTPAQRKAVEQLIESYIRSNPEIVMRALEEAHKREQAAEDKKRSDALAGIVGDLARDADVPSFGPADADVTVVEFSDYNCGYCKAATPRLFDTVQADGKVRVLFVELPILADSSVYAARAALAAARQGKYAAFHRAMMGTRGQVSAETVRAAAQSAGLDWARAEKDMADERTGKAIERNMERARALEVRGTPAFVFGKSFVPGAISADQMKSLIAAARKG